jgi:hypothetical protein
MTDGEKIHILLTYVIETDPSRFGWDSSELTPAFNNALSEYEIQYLCQQLIDNSDAIDCTTKDGFAIGINKKSKAVFYGKKYLKGNESSTVKVEIGQLQNISGSTINAPINQIGKDKFDNKTSSNIVSRVMSIKPQNKSKIWTISNILFIILTTVIGGLLVLIFWEQIIGLF